MTGPFRRLRVGVFDPEEDADRDHGRTGLHNAVIDDRKIRYVDAVKSDLIAGAYTHFNEGVRDTI